MAQRGTFTVHGSGDATIDAFLHAQGKPSTIELIEIASSAAVALNEALYAFAITKSSLFPDLDSLVSDLKLDHGIELPIPKDQVQDIDTERIRRAVRGRQQPANFATETATERVVTRAFGGGGSRRSRVKKKMR
jgi:hypothetical protein